MPSLCREKAKKGVGEGAGWSHGGREGGREREREKLRKGGKEAGLRGREERAGECRKDRERREEGEKREERGGSRPVAEVGNGEPQRAITHEQLPTVSAVRVHCLCVCHAN